MADAELPDTHDPFELLGVGAGADVRELKRAYVRLIKVFRPDERPDEFRRIRSAFELARELRGHAETPARASFRPPTADPVPNGPPKAEPDSEDPPTAEPRLRPVPDIDVGSQPGAELAADVAVAPPPSVEPLEGLRRLLDDGAHAEALTSFDALLEARPEDSALYALGLQLARATDDADLHCQLWVDALGRGVDMAFAARHLEPQIIDALVAAGSLRWQVLRQQPHAGFAAWLFRESVAPACLSGRTDQVLADIASAEFRRDALAAEGLEPAVWRALSIACWDDPERALALLREHAPEASREDPELERLELTLPLVDAFREVRERACPTPAFDDAIRYGLVDGPVQQTLARRAAEDLQARPDRWLRSIDQLHAHAPSLVHHMLVVSDAWEGPDDRLWDELTEAERDWLSAGTEALDRKLNNDFANAAHNYVIGLLLVAVVASFFWVGWWGLLVLAGGFVLMMATTSMLDRRLYRRLVRPFLVERFASRGVSPDRVLESITQNGRWSDDVGRFDDPIEADLPLYAIAAMHRVRLRLNVGPKVEGGMREHAPTLTGYCATHPERIRQIQCTHCLREACGSCSDVDPILGDYCVDCVGHRLRDKRTRLFDTEKYVHLLSAIDFMAASVFALAVVASWIEEGPLGPTGAIALVAFTLYASAGVGMRLRLGWGRPVQMLGCVPLAFAFPVGTIWAFVLVRKLMKPPWKAVFSADFVRARKMTPEMRVPRWYVAFDVLAGLAFVGGSLWMLIH